MKKIITLAILSIMLSGCANTIKCKTTNSDNDINVEYIIKYKDNYEKIINSNSKNKILNSNFFDQNFLNS